MADGEYVVGLRRLGDNVKKHRLIDLSVNNEVTIGRSPDVTVCLLSNMISRCHAILKKQDGTNIWTIKDNKSLNGIFINGKKLDAQQVHTLREGDIIQLGVPKSAEEPAEFVFQFHNKITTKRSRPKSTDENGCSEKKFSMKRIRIEENRHVDHCKTVINSGNKYDESDGPSTSGAKVSPYLEYRRKVNLQDEEAVSKLKELEKKLADMQRQLHEKEQVQDEMKQKLQEEQKRRENQTLEMTEKLKQKETELQNQTEEMKERLKEKEEELEKELTRKKAEEDRLKEELENQLLNREAELMEQLQQQKDSLIEEKQKVEANLQDAMAKALEEKDKKLEEELIQQKEKLQRVIEQKESEQKMLASQLQETKDEKDKQKEAMLHAREDILSNFADLMETELQCTICSELFIQATSLPCSHSYCSLCITQWMKVKKECPMCRAPIASYMRSIALDSYINTMVEHLSDELKERRKTLIEARKKEQEKLDEANKEATTAANPRGGRGRGRGRRGGRGRRRGGQNNTAAQSPARRPIIIESEGSDEDDVVVTEADHDHDSEVSSSDSDAHYYSQNSSEDDSDYIHGEAGAYFGGYGACFICGARGHWANGCPYR